MLIGQTTLVWPYYKEERQTDTSYIIPNQRNSLVHLCMLHSTYMTVYTAMLIIISCTCMSYMYMFTAGVSEKPASQQTTNQTDAARLQQRWETKPNPVGQCGNPGSWATQRINCMLGQTHSGLLESISSEKHCDCVCNTHSDRASVVDIPTVLVHVYYTCTPEIGLMRNRTTLVPAF